MGDQSAFPLPGPGDVPGPSVLCAVGFDLAPAWLCPGRNDWSPDAIGPIVDTPLSPLWASAFVTPCPTAGHRNAPLSGPTTSGGAASADTCIARTATAIAASSPMVRKMDRICSLPSLHARIGIRARTRTTPTDTRKRLNEHTTTSDQTMKNPSYRSQHTSRDSHRHTYVLGGPIVSPSEWRDDECGQTKERACQSPGRKESDQIASCQLATKDTQRTCHTSASPTATAPWDTSPHHNTKPGNAAAAASDPAGATSTGMSRLSVDS